MVARLLKCNNEVVFEHLLTPEVPFMLDYLEVVFSLCEVMCRIYAKFLEEVRQYNTRNVSYHTPVSSYYMYSKPQFAVEVSPSDD